MPWECLNCGLRNKDILNDCEECFTDKETATTMIVKQKKTMCRDCGHQHREGQYCHVYCEMDDDWDEDENDDNGEGDDDADGDGDDGSDDGLGLTKLRVRQGQVKVVEDKVEKDKPLPTPEYCKVIGFGRCNCDSGVPNQSRRYEHIPKKVNVGTITVQFYDDVIQNARKEDEDEAAPTTYMSKEDEKRHRQEMKMKKLYRFAEMLPHVLSFLEVGQVSYSAVVSRHYNYGCSLYKYYTDVRDCIPWNVYRPHVGPVESVTAISNHSCGHVLVVSSGDRRILISNPNTGVTLQMVARDSGSVPFLLYHDFELYAASSNGSCRSFTIPHNLARIAPNRTMWEHTRGVKRMMLALPSQGFCTLHGLDSHICHLYTASEDSYTSKSLRQAVITCVTQSPRHIIAGTSDASVVLFTKEDVCERLDIHQCNTPGASKLGCLQVTLRLSEAGSMRTQSGDMPIVKSVLCTGLYGVFSHIWAADSVGQISVWKNTKKGLDFKALLYWRAHNTCINDMVATSKHIVTVSDDGYCIIHDIVRFVSIRCIHMVTWCLDRNLIGKPQIPRRLKCLHVDEDQQDGGLMLIGTSYGEVMICAIGTTL